MNRRLIQTFLLIAICISIPLFHTYFQYNDLAEADFFFPGVKFESSDLGSFLPSKQDESNLLLFIPSMSAFLAAAPGPEQMQAAFLPHLFSETLISVLRC